MKKILLRYDKTEYDQEDRKLTIHYVAEQEKDDASGTKIDKAREKLASTG